MTDSKLLLDILLVTTAAFIGGWLANSLRLPTIVGFLAAGVAIGPYTPGPSGNLEDVGHAADIGVILLMFGIGVHLSLRQLLQYRRLILLGGGIQIVATVALGFGVGTLLGFSWQVALVVGFLAASTSTVVAVKILESRQELASVPGILTIGILILQDLAAVVMVIVIPSLDGDGLVASDLLIALGKGVLLIAFTYVLGTRVLPGVWRHIAYTRSRELSLLAALTLAVGFAAGSGLLGLSVAFGAFLAGLAVSENRYGYQALSDTLPLREIFASVFFVSMGMLIEPNIAWHHPTTVIAILMLIVVGKSLISLVSLKFAGLNLAQALTTALLLAQVGEFSFVLARAALQEEVISDDLSSAFLMAAVISILINPALVRSSGPLMRMFGSIPLLRGLAVETPRSSGADSLDSLNRHVVICGFGGAGRALARSLAGRGLPFVVIDNNPFILDANFDDDEIPFVYGDATRLEVLELAHAELARVIAITLPSITDSRLIALNVRRLNNRIDIVARGSEANFQLLRETGAAEVVSPNFEASLEFVRHVLHRYGIDSREIVALQARRRAEFYREPQS